MSSILSKRCRLGHVKIETSHLVYLLNTTTTILSVLTAILPGESRLAGTRMSPFWILLAAKVDEGGA